MPGKKLVFRHTKIYTLVGSLRFVARSPIDNDYRQTAGSTSDDVTIGEGSGENLIIHRPDLSPGSSHFPVLHIPWEYAQSIFWACDSIAAAEMEWLRRNQTAIPWALLAADLSLRLGSRLYKTYHGYYQDEAILDSTAPSLVPNLSDKEAADLPYPPDSYPGARDVLSPYGSLRIYEWGLDDGRKVLLVHGISNPCVAMGAMAQGLVDRGCRVILFDLPGRGYSTAPMPTPQSARFFITCILLALISSPISWMGNARFSLIGYSLGGGIATNFTSYFPSMVSSLVLLAPGGLIRTENINFTNKLLYNYGVLSEALLENIVTRRLRSGVPPIPLKTTTLENNTLTSGEIPTQPLETPPPLSKVHPNISLQNVVTWQTEANQGFVKSYISSLRYGPISNQQSHWARIGQRLNAQNLNAAIGKTDAVDRSAGLQNAKVLIICGKNDTIVIPQELREDAAMCLGEGNLEFREVDAGHELPVTRSEEIVDSIWRFWRP